MNLNLKDLIAQFKPIICCLSMVADPKPESPKPSRRPRLPMELLRECQFHLAAVGSGGNVWFWKHSMSVFPKHFPGIFFLKKFFFKKWICSNLKLSQIKK